MDPPVLPELRVLPAPLARKDLLVRSAQLAHRVFRGLQASQVLRARKA